MRKHSDQQQQLDFFVAYLTDLPLRDQRDTMERPFFSLSKRRITPIDYTSPDGRVRVQVSANAAFGMASIWDADILIWAASQLTDLVNRGDPQPPRTIRFAPYDLLTAIGRGTSGRDYAELRAALSRLQATTIRTTIRAGTRDKFAMFSWLDSWREVTDTVTGNSLGIEITLPNWFYSGIVAKGGVLAINQAYFQLTSGLRRWLYRLARKHAGHQASGFFISLPTLYEKSGSENPYRRFKFELHKIIDQDDLPEYHAEWIEDTAGNEPTVHIIRRSQLSLGEVGYEPEQPHDRRRPR